MHLVIIIPYLSFLALAVLGIFPRCLAITMYKIDFLLSVMFVDYSILLCADYEQCYQKYSITHHFLWKTTLVISFFKKLEHLTKMLVNIAPNHWSGDCQLIYSISSFLCVTQLSATALQLLRISSMLIYFSFKITQLITPRSLADASWGTVHILYSPP
jgi:hypothetical protein